MIEMISKQQLILPTQLSEALAEETGIHIGDGSMSLSRSGGKNHWEYVHSTHLLDDKEHSLYVKKLMKKLYNLEPYEKIQKTCMMLVYTRRDLVLFKKKLGLPMGKKNDIRIPNWILNNECFMKTCVRGIVDTDGCLRFRKPFKGKLQTYPELKVTNKSKILIEQLKDIFNVFGLTSSIYKEKISERKPNPIYNLNLCGVKNLNKYVVQIGFSNNKHLNKYLFWKKHGYCPPYFSEKWRRRDLNPRSLRSSASD